MIVMLKHLNDIEREREEVTYKTYIRLILMHLLPICWEILSHAHAPVGERSRPSPKAGPM